MMYLYFERDLGALELQEIWNWAYRHWGVNGETTVWGWITTPVPTNPVGDRQVIGIRLPDKEAVVAFKLTFSHRTYGEFETIEKVFL